MTLTAILSGQFSVWLSRFLADSTEGLTTTLSGALTAI